MHFLWGFRFYYRSCLVLAMSVPRGRVWGLGFRVGLRRLSGLGLLSLRPFKVFMVIWDKRVV